MIFRILKYMAMCTSPKTRLAGLFGGLSSILFHGLLYILSKKD